MITEWNKQATQDSALGGGKRVVVLALLGLENVVLQTLVGHHSRMGVAHYAFTDDAFYKKKLLLGHQCRVMGGGPAWSARLSVRAVSFKSFVTHAIHEQETKSASIRVKFRKEKLAKFTLPDKASPWAISVVIRTWDQYYKTDFAVTQFTDRF